MWVAHMDPYVLPTHIWQICRDILLPIITHMCVSHAYGTICTTHMHMSQLKGKIVVQMDHMQRPFALQMDHMHAGSAYGPICTTQVHMNYLESDFLL